VKKSDKDLKLNNPDITLSNDFELDKIKTTNVNVLLNRVRLDKKRTLKKRIIFSLILGTIVSLLAVFFII
tara:strand:+ start:896 stop:1105 length:210 start_codon:yes stop_codon:yes gene_type:complete